MPNTKDARNFMRFLSGATECEFDKQGVLNPRSTYFISSLGKIVSLLVLMIVWKFGAKQLGCFITKNEDSLSI